MRRGGSLDPRRFDPYSTTPADLKNQPAGLARKLRIALLVNGVDVGSRISGFLSATHGEQDVADTAGRIPRIAPHAEAGRRDPGLTVMQDFKAAIVPVTGFQQNCTILWDAATKRGVVIDPGGEVPRIRAALDKLGIGVEKIVLTHGHLDHACGRGGAQGGARGGRAARCRSRGPTSATSSCSTTSRSRAPRMASRMRATCTPDRFLHGGRDDHAGRAWTSTSSTAPATRPAAWSMSAARSRFALVGDVLFRGSVGRTDFAYGDTEALLRSIHEKLLPLGDDISFICGHGPGSTFGEERRRAIPFLTGAA